MKKIEKQDCKRIIDCGENNIEFLRNSETATVCFSQGRYVSRIKKLSEQYPDECKIMYTNADGSIVAHVPTRWIKVSPTRKVSDEQREASSQRFKEMQASGKLKKGREKNG